MTILPMRKCKKCGQIFLVIVSDILFKCPSCGSRRLKKATPLDYLFNKKILLGRKKRF